KHRSTWSKQAAGDGSWNGWTASQRRKSAFKVDCETPNTTVSWQYRKVTKDKSTYTFGAGSNWKRATAGNAEEIKSSDSSVTKDLGDDLVSGQTFEITATATIDTFSENGYEKAVRTVIQINNDTGKMEFRVNKMAVDQVINGVIVWPGKGMLEEKTDSKKLGLFLRGGNNPVGPNTVEGLPTNWTFTESESALFFEESGDKKTYTIISWSITSEKFYFMPFAGLMTEDADIKGPQYGVNAQNRWIGEYTNYYVTPGEYLYLENKQTDSVSFEPGEPGKAKQFY
ncbi:MAG: hypothetical protein MJ178_10075, partial [Treponemataceae bacterium]|nr:hypothetical protein [Treponemataceae bacterium]